MNIRIILLLTISQICLNISSDPIVDYTSEVGEHFIHLSGYAYCSDQKIIKGVCCSKFLQRNNWSLMYSNNLERIDFNYAILSNVALKKIVIAFPGTRKAIELLKETYYQEGKSIINDTIKVMKYFADVYDELKKTNFDYVLKKLLKPYSEYQVIFLGHSLGGAMASIMALDSVLSKSLVKTSTSPMLLTYGQPRTGNDIFANEVMKNIPVVFRVVKEGDLIPNMPTCSLKSFFLNSECQTVLPDDKFDANYVIPNQDIKKQIIQNFMNWHIGGLIHYNEPMTQFVNCGNVFGENNKKDGCQLKLVLDPKRHSYFGYKLRSMCEE
jgi:hypothetical protein